MWKIVVALEAIGCLRNPVITRKLYIKQNNTWDRDYQDIFCVLLSDYVIFAPLKGNSNFWTNQSAQNEYSLNLFWNLVHSHTSRGLFHKTLTANFYTKRELSIKYGHWAIYYEGKSYIGRSLVESLIFQCWLVRY